jgi:quinol monooxygenase YgiN
MQLESGSKIGSGGKPMLTVHVHVHVKPESVADFRQATIENARSRVQEPGIARFDVAEQQDDATRLVLIEAYRSPEAAAEHKETAHYTNDEGYALVTARNAAAAGARSPVGQGLGCAVGAPGELQSDFQSR